MTSPALKLSPSLSFHDAIPPSVIVGDLGRVSKGGKQVGEGDTRAAAGPSVTRNSTERKSTRRAAAVRVVSSTDAPTKALLATHIAGKRKASQRGALSASRRL